MGLDQLQGSASLEVLDLVFKKRSEGNNVISFYIGEPVFDTPKAIIDAAVEGMRSGMTHYVSSFGIEEFREAAEKKVARKNGIKCSADNIIFMSGKMAIYAVGMALNLSPGSEVLVPDPGYFYSEPSLMAGLVPVTYDLNSDYSFNFDDIRKKINSRTRAIFINTPSNPTGVVYSEKELRELYSICREKNIKIVSDEAYEDLVYEKSHFSIGSFESEPDLVISIFTLSKSYSMTGWRGGYIIAEKNIVKRIGKFMEHAVTCFPAFIQHAAVVALTKCDREVMDFREKFRQRRDLAVSRLREIDQLSVNKVEGAFYIFPEFSVKTTSDKLSREILNKANVALLPGSAFGKRGEGHLRFSYSGSLEDIDEGMNRLAKFFNDL
jgi:aspartate/methionine/tyrosine aminotransferase